MKKNNIEEAALKIFSLFLKLVVSLGILYFLFVKFDYSSMIQEIKKLELPDLLLILGIYLFSVFISAIKWKVLLPTVSVWALYRVLICSRFYSIVLPGQIFAEVSKVALLPKEQTDIGNSSTSVVMDKVTGMLSLFFLGILGVSFSNSEIPQVLSSALWYAFLIILIFLCFLNNSLVNQVIAKVSSILKLDMIFQNASGKKLLNFIFKIKNCLQAYNRKTLFTAVLIGILYQLVNTEVFVSIGKSINANILFGDWMWVNAILSVALLIPISFAGVGIREGTLVTFLALLDVDGQKAMAISVLFFTIQLIEGIIGSAIMLVRKFLQYDRSN